MNFYPFRYDNKNARTICDICLKEIIKTTGNVIDFVLVSLMLTLKKFHNLF